MKYVEKKVQFGGEDIGKPEPGVMLVFEENGIPLMVDFLCPCGCGNTTPTPLVAPGQVKQPNDRHWNLSRGPNGPTLTPSIRWLSGCKAHFHITNGEAVMCADSGK
jgi:hypothetical protein